MCCGGSGGNGGGSNDGGGGEISLEKFAADTGENPDNRLFKQIYGKMSPSELKTAYDARMKVLHGTNWDAVRAQNAKEQEQVERNIGRAMSAPKTQSTRKKDKYYSPDWA